jgi:CRISPR/Cas system-associated endonuclease Cas3-HD
MLDDIKAKLNRRHGNVSKLVWILEWPP